MNNNYIIKNAYSYFDSKAEKNVKENNFDKINKWNEISQGSDIIRPIIQFNDKNDKLLFKAEYEIIGTEYPNLKKNNVLWVWGWAHPQLNKNQTLLSRELLKYGLDIPKSDDYMDMFLKSILTNSRMKLHTVEKELVIALSLYLTKKEGIIKIDAEEKGIRYRYWLIITKIIK
jgi:hypothetical protein